MHVFGVCIVFIVFYCFDCFYRFNTLTVNTHTVSVSMEVAERRSALPRSSSSAALTSLAATPARISLGNNNRKSISSKIKNCSFNFKDNEKSKLHDRLNFQAGRRANDP